MRRTALVILVVSFTPGCEEDDDAWKDDYSFVRHGQDVTVFGYGRNENDACAGSFDALDTHTRSVMDLVGAEQAAQYNYRWMSSEYIEGLCPLGVDACTVHGEPYAQSLPYMHEVVHMVAYQMPDHGCAPLLEEGLGEYLGGPRYREGAPLDYDLRKLMTTREHPGARGYTRAGHFVSFVIETYGVEGFRRLCGSVPFSASLEDWDGAITRSLGMSLDELVAEYESYPECSQQQYRARLWECSDEADFVFTADDRSFVFEAGCADPRAMDATPSELGDALVTRLVYFSTDTWVDVTPGFGASFMSQECAPCSAEPQVQREQWLDDTLNPHHFRAGLHEIVVFFDRSNPVRFRMSALPY